MREPLCVAHGGGIARDTNRKQHAKNEKRHDIRHGDRPYPYIRRVNAIISDTFPMIILHRRRLWPVSTKTVATGDHDPTIALFLSAQLAEAYTKLREG